MFSPQEALLGQPLSELLMQLRTQSQQDRRAAGWHHWILPREVPKAGEAEELGPFWQGPCSQISPYAAQKRPRNTRVLG